MLNDQDDDLLEGMPISTLLRFACVVLRSTVLGSLAVFVIDAQAKGMHLCYRVIPSALFVTRSARPLGGNMGSLQTFLCLYLSRFYFCMLVHFDITRGESEETCFYFVSGASCTTEDNQIPQMY